MHTEFVNMVPTYKNITEVIAEEYESPNSLGCFVLSTFLLQAAAAASKPRDPKSLAFFFFWGGVLIIFIVYYTPKPYSNFQGPYIGPVYPYDKTSIEVRLSPPCMGNAAIGTA